jgi:1-acyl-sn-glycerol-3-phosphate acyltransferase
MKRPPVTLENYQAVYDFYGQYQPNRLLNRLGSAAMHAITRPRVHISEPVSERITELLQRNASLVLAANHQNLVDPLVIVGTARSTPALQPIQGKTVVWAQHGLFKHGLIRRGIDIMGSVPVFRKKDHPDDPLFDAGQALLAAARQQLDAHRHLAIFPEGARNKVDPTKLQDIGSGIGHIVTGLHEQTEVAVIPLGITYGLEVPEGSAYHHLGYYRHADVAIGEPITGPFGRPNAAVRSIRDGMNSALAASISEHLKAEADESR